ncbi:murein L,D-transpeptidase catalytic domain-containing protein [Niabella drilacis]|uniref:L,D-transpeptidase catalytic domain n=1 Tax=Niabella drilacis (strain DSM 25811 / CCM 8410 / CCUG 62505 / LMG 26954 / E90) TaxID=1285928 RepID=A0A1G6SIM2_NIADE|nr:murein L,D-transpeptidase catalytic domain family protein [Niabella drilacis]SDD16688.1 L,D-transpeptidase catalytic domain [Niabella drilacis]
MNKLLLLVSLLLLTGGFVYYYTSHAGHSTTPALISPAAHPEAGVVYSPPAAQLAVIKTMIRNRHFNPDRVFLVNMRLPSSRKRFFVYDLNQDAVITSGLVTHGRCSERWLEGRRYSNEMGSRCTSLGHYRIGSSYQGTFGLAYKLYGLDSSNNKAFERFVVLHSHACVPENEVDYEICQSDGCPTVSPAFLKQLQSIIDTSAKPILLSIYDSGQ